MTPLYMISMSVALRPLRQQAAVHGLTPDEGRMLHHALAEAFGKGAIQPFRLLPGRNGSHRATLYAYTQYTAAELQATAAATAPPETALMFDLPGLASKAMPASWRPGQRLAFDVKCLPVRRLLRPLPPWPGERSGFDKGAEVDVYLADAMRQFPAGLPDTTDRLALREVLYHAWLADRLAPAAVLVQARLVSVQRSILRRGPSRQIAPEAIFHGELSITDPACFSGMLAGGVGRHCAYGFGMLLLRPPRG